MSSAPSQRGISTATSPTSFAPKGAAEQAHPPLEETADRFGPLVAGKINRRVTAIVRALGSRGAASSATGDLGRGPPWGRHALGPTCLGADGRETILRGLTTASTHARPAAAEDVEGKRTT